MDPLSRNLHDLRCKVVKFPFTSIPTLPRFPTRKSVPRIREYNRPRGHPVLSLNTETIVSVERLEICSLGPPSMNQLVVHVAELSRKKKKSFPFLEQTRWLRANAWREPTVL